MTETGDEHVAQGSTLPPLASVDDVRALGVTAEDTAVLASLDKASARFRAEARNQITATDYAQVLRVEDGGLVILPRIPVVEITEVRTLTSQGQAGAVLTGWTFDGIQVINVNGLAGLVINLAVQELAWTNVWVEWSAGFATVPEDVRWAVASMVERALSAPASGIAGETIGDYTWRGGGYTASGAFSMSKDELATAHRYRSRRGSVHVAY